MNILQTEWLQECLCKPAYPTYRALAEQVPGTVEITLLDSHPEDGLLEIVQKKALSDALQTAGIELHARDTAQEAKEQAKKEAALQAENQFRARLFEKVRSQPLLMLATPDLQMLAEFGVRSLYEQSRFRVAKLYYPEETNRTAVERLQERIPNMLDTELIGLLRDILLIGETKKEPWHEDPPTQLLAAAERIGIDPEQVRADTEREACALVTVYRHPDSPETEWNGKGRKPVWVEAWESLGKSIDDLAVKVTPAPKKKGKKQ